VEPACWSEAAPSKICSCFIHVQCASSGDTTRSSRQPMFPVRRALLICKLSKESITIVYRRVSNAKTVPLTTLQELSPSRSVSPATSLTQTTVSRSATMFQPSSPQFTPDTDPKTATPLLKSGEKTSLTSMKILNAISGQNQSPPTSSAVHL
jgi:hypothetical protein